MNISDKLLVMQIELIPVKRRPGQFTPGIDFDPVAAALTPFWMGTGIGRVAFALGVSVWNGCSAGANDDQGLKLVSA